MTARIRPLRLGLWTLLLAGALTLPARAQAVLDVGTQIPNPQSLLQGLFPEEACAPADPAPACQVARGAVRYSLAAADFRLGSSELPGTLRQQLDVFALVLRGKRPPRTSVRIESHADASGEGDKNLALTQRRAEAVKAYLVSQGVDEAVLVAVGMGAQAPRQASNPFGAENRRIEIGRVAVH